VLRRRESYIFEIVGGRNTSILLADTNTKDSGDPSSCSLVGAHAAAFDDRRRSNAFLLLANIIGEGLLSAEELKQFSQEAQPRIKMIQELRGA